MTRKCSEQPVHLSIASVLVVLTGARLGALMMTPLYIKVGLTQLERISVIRITPTTNNLPATFQHHEDGKKNII